MVTERIVIRGGYVLTMDPELGDLPVGDVLVERDRIVARAAYRDRHVGGMSCCKPAGSRHDDRHAGEASRHLAPRQSRMRRNRAGERAGGGYLQRRLRSASTSTPATARFRYHFRSEGTTYHGACPVLQRVRSAS